MSERRPRTPVRSARDVLPATMRALEISRYDPSFRSLRCCEKALPRPTRGEVLVRIEYSPINPSDLMFVAGRYVLEKSLPVVPGMVASGTIVKAGGGWLATALVGRRVCCSAPEDRDGTWAEYMVTPAELCVPLFPGVTNEQGCNLLANPATALGLLAQIRRGGHRAALQNAAAGEVGRMLALLCRDRGIPLLQIVHRPEQVELLKEAGARHVLWSGAEDFEEALRDQAAALSATIAFDAVAGEITKSLLRALPPRGQVCIFGRLSNDVVAFDALDLLVKDERSLRGFSIYEWLLGKSLAGRLRVVQQAQALVRRYRPRPARVATLGEIAMEFEDIARSPTTRGKVWIAPAAAGTEIP